MDILVKDTYIITVAPQIDFGTFDEDGNKWRLRDENGELLFYCLDDGYMHYPNLTMPNDYAEGKYFYDAEEGFVYNDAYIPYVSFESRVDEAKALADILFVMSAENGSIDDTTASEHPYSFSRWEANQHYKVGNLRQYKGTLYKCILEHDSLVSWTPDVSPSLWVRTSDPAEEWPEWSQPIGATDAYSLGDKVSHNNQHWVSNVNANTWAPGVYGWDLVP